MHKADAAAITLMAWMLTISGIMGVLQASEIRLFIVTALVGFFTIVYMIHPTFSKPGYIRNLYRMAIACMVLFGLVTLTRVLELIQYWGQGNG